MQRYKILWADDEIELLKPHVLFLTEKECDVTAVNSGVEAYELIKEEDFDIVFLDESMPGMTGLETLEKIQELKPNVPVVMITKNEEEHLMEEAIGAKISDYLIKPINPKQVLLSIKKLLDNKRLVSERTNTKYQREFQGISMVYNDIITYEEWGEVYKKLVYHEIEIDNTEYRSMREVLEMQKSEANTNFTKFITRNYEDWVNGDDFDKPLMSNELMQERVFPCLGEQKVFFIVIDNLRFDQWKVFESIINPYFKTELEDVYFSILPTTTQYARNSIFSGMMPLEISKKYPQYWVNEEDEGGKNNFEGELLAENIKRAGLQINHSYHKILNPEAGNSLVDNLSNLLHNDLNVIVYNFVDMLSHARTDLAVIKELAKDEAAYRSLAKSWLEHSSFLALLKGLQKENVKVIITTDHGTIRVKKPVKIVGDRKTNSNLRYKTGRNLSYNEKDVFVCKDPEAFKLPKQNMTSTFVFTKADDYFVYPNNYNHYVKAYNDSFQHGGISLEEMIIPFIELTPRK